MQLESSAFTHDGLIPTKYTCEGDSISPPLNWHNPPTGTNSFVLIVEDPDAPQGTFTHWVVYDIPASIQQLPEGIVSEPTIVHGGTQGKNDFGQIGFGGPCPPAGSHRYFFKLHALDRQLSLAPGANKQEIESAMAEHILESAELMARYFNTDHP